MAKSNDYYVCDFETTSYNFYKKNGYTKVWLYAVSKNDTIIKNGDSIEGFFNYIQTLKNPTIYFHNLKFDGAFIIYYLLTNGFIYNPNLRKKDNKGFSALIGDLGEFYQLQVNFKPNKYVVFRDSLKLIPLKVSQMAEAFNLPIAKEEIDYEDYTINDKTLSYITNDVLIVNKSMEYFKQNGMTKMTIGSCSYDVYQRENEKLFSCLPVLEEDFLKEWRKAYRGGRTQVNPKYQNKVLKNVYRYDINSMYPSVMRYCDLPYGQPYKIDKRNTYAFELYKVDIWFKLKEGHLPTLLKKGGLYDTGDTYYIDSDLNETIYISSIDLQILERHYNILYIDFIEMYGFKTTKVLFKDFVDKYYALKNNSQGGMKTLYKLILNNLYGKFGSKCEGRTKIPYLDNGIIKYKYGELQKMKRYYLPLAIAIVSYAHLLLDDAIETIGVDNVIYMDTDSLHTLKQLPKDLVDNKALGKFKLEGVEKRCKYVRQKCYIYKDTTNKWHITCSGMAPQTKEWLIKRHKNNVINTFKVGLEINENTKGIKLKDLKLQPKQVQGGVVLAPVPFRIL